jgi:hypothetical protein
MMEQMPKAVALYITILLFEIHSLFRPFVLIIRHCSSLRSLPKHDRLILKILTPFNGVCIIHTILIAEKS